jgi:uncharacterized membrane protein YphA (DoxX/SURF4 family)
MNHLLAHLPTVARVLLGLIFFVFGLNGFLHFLPLPPMEGRAAEFMGGLAAAGYFFPMLKATEVVVGLSLLTNRFVPLALVVLAPITVNIVAFHSLAPAGLPMAVLIVGLHLAVAWHHGAAFGPLLSARFQPSAEGEQAPSDRILVEAR